MKKLFVIFAISFFGIYSAQAQSGAFGAKITPMLSYAKMINNDNYTFESLGVVPGIGFGPSYKKYFSENFNVDVAALFTWQDVEFQATPTVTGNGNGLQTLKVKTAVKYLQIPVILEASFPIVEGLNGMMDFGLTPAIELSSLADVSDANDLLIKSQYDYSGTPVNLYLNAGAGVSYDITDVLMVSGVIMYNHGVLDIWYDETDAQYIPELDLKNHTVSLNIGIHIKF